MTLAWSTEATDDYKDFAGESQAVPLIGSLSMRNSLSAGSSAIHEEEERRETE
jgi:hypothetical protein